LEYRDLSGIKAKAFASRVKHRLALAKLRGWSVFVRRELMFFLACTPVDFGVFLTARVLGAPVRFGLLWDALLVSSADLDLLCVKALVWLQRQPG
jgi:hypothetical protein